MEIVAGALLIVVSVLFLWGANQSETALLKKAAQRYGLQLGPRCLTGPGLEVTVTTSGRSTYLNYRLPLPGAPPELVLMREGAVSGGRQLQGASELNLGDQDFDDLVWVETSDEPAARAWLTESRRALLVELFWQLPEARLEGGAVQGQTSFGARALAAVLDQGPRILQQIDEPLTRRSRLPGWVHRYQRHYHARWALGVGLGLTWLAGMSLLEAPGGQAPLAVLTLFGLILMLCALAVYLGWPSALRNLRRALRGTLWAGLATLGWMTVHLGRQGHLGVALPYAFLGLFWWAALEAWCQSLWRVRES